MTAISSAAIEKLETLAAWHRINADHSDSDWMWELRVRAAEDLERQAADLRTKLSHAADGRRRSAPDDRWRGGAAFNAKMGSGPAPLAQRPSEMGMSPRL